ncbi:MAG: CHAD domain-containing protein [Magnetococcales bacterium]|nr:CHAD domain-containing protein [Magnetococcales bacterium]
MKGLLPEKGLVLQRQYTTQEAFQSILRHNLASIGIWEGIAYEGVNPEGVHQIRVALRRLRSALVLFRRVVPREVTALLDEEMRWLALEVASARDLDVLLNETLKHMTGRISLPDGERRLRNLVQLRREAAYQQVRHALDGERYQRFKESFSRWIDEQAWYQSDLAAEQREGLMQTIDLYAAVILEKRFGKLLRQGAAMGKMSPAELHQLRIACKKFRYALEFFNPLFGSKGEVSVLFGNLKKLQELLGIMNDGAQMVPLLTRLLAGEEDRDLLQYAGSVVGWCARQNEEVKNPLGKLWQLFVTSPVPWR